MQNISASGLFWAKSPFLVGKLSSFFNDLLEFFDNLLEFFYGLSFFLKCPKKPASMYFSLKVILSCTKRDCLRQFEHTLDALQLGRESAGEDEEWPNRPRSASCLRPGMITFQMFHQFISFPHSKYPYLTLFTLGEKLSQKSFKSLKLSIWRAKRGVNIVNIA